MRKKRFTEQQIIKVLKQVEGGRSAADVCREYGISQATYYNWKAKYGGMEASDIHGKFMLIFKLLMQPEYFLLISSNRELYGA